MKRVREIESGYTAKGKTRLGIDGKPGCGVEVAV
jgi:hypothetical protein